MLIQQIIELRVNEIEPRHRSPMTQNAFFDVLRFEFFLYLVIVLQIKLRGSHVIHITQIFAKPTKRTLISLRHGETLRRKVNLPLFMSLCYIFFAMLHAQLSTKNVKGAIKDFKHFAFQGSMLDLALGIILGTAFKDLAQSLVDHILMPVLGNLLGNVDFSELYWNLSETEYGTLQEALDAGAPVVQYGLFISNFVDFIILSLTVYIVLRVMFKSYLKKRLTTA